MTDLSPLASMKEQTMHAKVTGSVAHSASTAEEWSDELTDEYRRDLRAKSWGNLDVFASLAPPTPARTRQLLPPPIVTGRRAWNSSERILPPPAPLPAFALGSEPPALARTIPPPKPPLLQGRKGILLVALLAAVTTLPFLKSRPGKVVTVAAGHGGELLPNAEMVIDGTRTCSGARCTFDAAAGVHEVTARAEGYLPQLQLIAVGSGEAAAMNFRLERGGSSLDISGNPEGATLVVDGRWIGRLPLQVDLSPGLHRVRVEADGFSPEERTVKLKIGETKKIGDVALLARIGRVSIQSPLAGDDSTD